MRNININYMSKTFYTDYFQLNPVSDSDFLAKYNEIINWRIGAIILPATNFKKFANIIGTDIQVKVFREVVRGLYMIYKQRLTHNDLHTGNVMIEEGTEKVLIYDWDRAYAQGLGNNPILNDNPCKHLCQYSQCNLYIPDRPIDLLKILCYTTDNRANFYQFLSEGLNITNVPISGRSKLEIIRQGLLKCSDDACFFHKDGCSALYKPNHCPDLEEAILHMGETWEVIYGRAFRLPARIDRSAIPRADRCRDILKSAIIAITIAGSAAFAAYIGQQFGFRKQKFGMVAVERPLKRFRNDQESIRIAKMYRNAESTPEIENYAKKSTFKIDQEMARQIQQLTKYPLTKEMKDEIARLSKIPNNELTWDDFVKMEDLAEYIQYGPEQPVEKPELKSADLVPTEPFVEIMAQNDARKIYPAR